MSITQLKKNGKNSLAKLVEQNNKLAAKPNTDDRFWYPDVDKAGNGKTVIRFLAAPVGEDVPYVRYFSHGFQGPGGWYIENSLTTLGEADPVSEYNSKLWNSTKDDAHPARVQARKQKRNQNFVANIQVVEDSSHPEHEGQVKLFKFGKKIFDKVMSGLDDDPAINPFDMWEGANFVIKIRQKDGFRNYDNSKFDVASPLADSDDEIEAIWKQAHSLQQFVAKENFKTYDVLKSRLNKVLALNDDSAVDEPKKASAPKVKSVATPKPGGQVEDEDEAFFQNLTTKGFDE